MNKKLNVAVYLGKSGRVQQKYKDLAFETGAFIAKQGWNLVYGGSKTGTMGLVADGALSVGGKVHGVITDFLDRIEQQHENLTELTVVPSMHERKLAMFNRSDAFVILPGGLGTLDETFELLTWRQIDIHDKPVVFLNYDGFWDPLIALFEHLKNELYMLPQHMTLFRVINRLEELPEAIQNNLSDRTDHHTQWT